MSLVGPIHRHPTNVVLFAACWGILSVLLGGLVAPHIKDRTSVGLEIITWVQIVTNFLLLASLPGVIIFLLLRKWRAALSYFVSGCIAYSSIEATLMLKGDRFAFTSGPHREITEIYNLRKPEFDLIHSGARLVGLNRQCHPPDSCECWLVIDPSQSSGVVADVGRWHPPKARIFIDEDALPPFHFAMIDVRQINATAYSVLGCTPPIW
jgi:hypothetical protein